MIRGTCTFGECFGRLLGDETSARRKCLHVICLGSRCGNEFEDLGKCCRGCHYRTYVTTVQQVPEVHWSQVNDRVFQETLIEQWVEVASLVSVVIASSSPVSYDALFVPSTGLSHCPLRCCPHPLRHWSFVPMGCV